DTMAAAVRTRVFVGLEAGNGGNGEADAAIRLHQRPAGSDSEPGAAPDPEPDGPDADVIDDDGWRRFRPDVVVRGVIRRQRESDETELLAELALARAEEAVILTHV